MTQRDISVVLVELGGFTALLDPVDQVDASEAIARFHELVRTNLVDDARIVRLVGGVAMIVTHSIPAAIMMALGLASAVRTQRPLHLLRGALHAGKAYERDGQVEGDDVTLAARIADHARTGEILCTTPVAVAARHLQIAAVVEVGPARFMRVPQPVELFRLRSARAKTESPA